MNTNKDTILPKRRTSVMRAVWVPSAIVVILALPIASFIRDSFRQADAERLYEVGMRAIAEGDLAAATIAAEALSSLEDAPPYANVLEGAVHLRSGRLSEAVSELRLASEDPKTAPLANFLAGETLYRNRQFNDAIRALSAATALDYSMTDAHRLLGAIYYDIGATSAAIESLQVVSQQAPEDARPHRLAGLIYSDMESYGQAASEYREALRRNPNLPDRDEVLLEFAKCLLEIGAHEELEKIVQQCVPSADALAIQAKLRLAQGQVAAATRLLDESLALSDGHLEALLLKGSIELESADPNSAVTTLKKAADYHPYEVQVHHGLSQAYALAGNRELADKHSKESLRLRSLREEFAELHAKASIDREDAELRYQLGVTAAKLGKSAIAFSWFSNALALDPTHSAAREALQSAMADQDAAEDAKAFRYESTHPPRSLVPRLRPSQRAQREGERQSSP